LGKHSTGRAAGDAPRFGTKARADGPAEPRGRLFGAKKVQTDFRSSVSVTQAMEILERIAERRLQYVGTSLGLADRIQQLP
jgi:hypothetical protein